MDRAVDSHHAEISLTCRRMLGMGALLAALAHQLSHVLMRLDGVDQAKFRVPRQLVKTHAFEKLIRPALHVQGGWVQGFASHLAVADADMKKDTNNNVEVLARLLESIYQTWKALPLPLMLIQDNTCRECNNQQILELCESGVPRHHGQHGVRLPREGPYSRPSGRELWTVVRVIG